MGAEQSIPLSMLQGALAGIKSPPDEPLSGLLEALFVTEEDEDVNAELVKASAQGDGGKVEELLQRSDCDANAVYAGYTPLHVAAFLGNTEVIKALFRHNVDLDIEDKHGLRAIHHAALSGNPAVINLLYSKGADLNVCSNHSQTPLSIAVHEDDMNIVEALLKLGCDANVKYPAGDTLLQRTIVKQQDEITELLLKHKADITITNSKGFNALHLAAISGNTSAVQILLNNLPRANIVDEKKDDGFTALHLAAFNDRLGVAEVLVQGKANVDIQNCNMRTPLHLAVDKNHTKIARLLVTAGCNINIQDINGNTPLHCAVEEKRESLFTFLLEKTSDLTTTNKRGFDVFHFAALRGNFVAMQALLPKVAELTDVDGTMEGGFTALHIAAFNDHGAVTELLIQQGNANLDAQSIELKTPLHLAIEGKHKHIARMLLQRGCTVDIPDKEGNTPLHYAILSRKKKMVNLIFKFNPDITMTNKKGHTPLCLAAILGNTNILRILLSRLPHKSMVDTSNKDGITALHAAVLNDHVNVVWLLVHKGNANVDVQNAELHSPLHMAVGKMSTAIIKLLINAGCHTNTSDKDGDSPLHDCLRFLSASQLTQEDVAHLSNSLVASNDKERLMTSIAFYLVANGAELNSKNKMGFTPLELCRDNQLSRALVESYKKRSGHEIPTVAECIEEDQSHQNDCNDRAQIANLPSGSQDQVTEAKASSDDGQCLESLQQRLKDLTCPICLDRTKNMIFLCGHGTCEPCSDRLSECPICRKTVEKKILLH